MKSDEDQRETFEDGDARNPASQAEVAALNLRVAALESQLAQLTRAMAFAPGASTVAAPRPQPLPSPTLCAPYAPPPIPAAEAIAILPARQSLEDRLGSQIFNFIGMAALIIGASWALKLAFEHGLIGPAGRVIIGLAAGAGIILWSERFRRKGFGAFSYSLKAVGSGILYLSLWAAFQFYHLLPPGIAFALMVVVTAWNAFMAWSQDAELLAAYALAGGFATPLLLSTGGDQEACLFLYLATIDAASVLLIRWKPWRRLLLPAYLATAVYFVGWYSEFFHRGRPFDWDSQSAETALFAVIFFVIFAVVSLRGWTAYPQTDANVIGDVLIPFGNAAFIGLALYSVLQDSGLHNSLAWLMLALAAIYLGLTRLQATALASAMHLAMAVVFLTIAIPLKASGHTLTTAWLVEGLVLYWAASRMKAESRAPAKVLWILSAAGFILGLVSLAFHWFWFNDAPHGSFFNANLGSALVAIVSFAGVAWLAARHHRGTAETCDLPPLLLALIGIDLVALLLILGELSSPFNHRLHSAFANNDFADALLGLGVLASAAWTAYRLDREQPQDRQLNIVAGTTLVAFNLLTIITFVREIAALWPSTGFAGIDAEVQRSLAISAFLMAYAAILLAAGFSRRSAFVRWQALLLLIFTILKVFLSDVSGLGQGYRVVSFLGLGALLMAVSFAYQKDWLGLKAAAANPASEDPA